jgi:hypothetical protein
MKELLFGKDLYLVDSFHLFPHYYPTETYETDAKAIKTLQRDLKQEKEGNIYVIFLDSTHFDYSFPAQNLPFPFPKNIWLSLKPFQNWIHLIQDRYKNAIHYIDSLFGSTVNFLKEKGMYDNSIIIFTGDHGEEFFEEGYFFHGSRLSRMQTQIPIYYKFHPDLPKDIKQTKITSQMDIFPTIFHHILGENLFKNILEGNSLLEKNASPFVMTCRYNASRSPYEFFFHNGEKKLLLRMENTKDITSSNTVQILSMQDEKGKPILFSPEEFQRAFRRIFPYFNSLKKEAASSSD